jgi:hypothetical protein
MVAMMVPTFLINKREIVRPIMIMTTVIDVLTKPIISALSPAKPRVCDVARPMPVGGNKVNKRGSQEDSP